MRRGGATPGAARGGMAWGRGGRGSEALGDARFRLWAAWCWWGWWLGIGVPGRRLMRRAVGVGLGGARLVDRGGL